MYHAALKEFKKLEAKSTKAAKLIAEEHCIFSTDDLTKKFTNKDICKFANVKNVTGITDDDFNGYWIFDNAAKTLTALLWTHYPTGWIMGSHSGFNLSFKFFDEKSICITFKWSTRENRLQDHYDRHEKQIIVDISML